MKTLRNIFFLAVVVLPLAAFSQRTITVTGGSLAKMAPDYAMITMTLTVQDVSVVGAFAKNDEFEARLRSALGSVGVQNADIEMRTFALNPTYDYSQPAGMSPKLTGYHYIATYAAKVKKIANLAKSLDAAAGSGATNVSVEGYGSSGAESLEKESLKGALAEAKEKATYLAKQMGGTLGDIVSITDAVSTGGGSGAPMNEQEREEQERRGRRGGNINPDEISRSSTLQVTFTVK